jgi:hypothetical protein
MEICFTGCCNQSCRNIERNKEELRANRQSVSGIHHSTQLKTNMTHAKRKTTSNFTDKKFSINSERMKKKKRNKDERTYQSLSAMRIMFWIITESLFKMFLA